jgi:hypothetical protein
MRMDFYIVAAETAIVSNIYGWRMVDMEDLAGVGCMILSIVFNGVLLLLNFWSVSIHEFFAYNTLDMADIKNCTDVRVRIDNQKQKTIKRFIVPLLIK